MKLTDNRGLKTTRWQVGELVIANDMEFNSYAEYTNFVDLLALFLDPEDESVDYVLSGMRLESITSLSFVLSAGSAISFSGYYFESTWGFVSDPGSSFVAVLPENTSFAVTTADPSSDRYDTVEIRPTDEAYQNSTRTFIDPVTGDIGENVVATRRDFSAEFQVLAGTPGGSAPQSTDGWIKIAEVRVPAGASALTTDDIRAVDRAHEWTTEAESVVRDSTVVDRTKTIPVGSGHRFTTLNEALDYFSEKQPLYQSEQIEIVLELQSGFTMSEQVLVHGIDFGWIRITSVDATVTIDRSALTSGLLGVFPAFYVAGGGVLPVIDAQFNMDTSGTATNRVGILATDGSTAIVTFNGGVQNAVYAGIYAHGGATATIASSNFSGATEYGLYAERGANVNAHAADFSGAGTKSIAAFLGATVNASAVSGGGGISAESGAIVNAISSTGTVTASNATAFDSNGNIVIGGGNFTVAANGDVGARNVNANQGSFGGNVSVPAGGLIAGTVQLTDAEWKQIAKINSTGISTTQWGYLGAMNQGVRSSDSPNFGGASINSTQYGYLGSMDQPVKTSDAPTFESLKGNTAATRTWITGNLSDAGDTHTPPSGIIYFESTSNTRLDIRDAGGTWRELSDRATVISDGTNYRIRAISTAASYQYIKVEP